MSGLKVRIDKYLDSDELRAPRVLANITAIDPSGTSNASIGPPRRERIPISHKPADAALIDLPPGTYYVETTLPSGETLADSATIKAGETRELVLKARHSPHEWFSWQHLVGNSRAPNAAPKPAPIQRRKKKVAVKKKAGGRRVSASPPLAGVGRAKARASVKVSKRAKAKPESAPVAKQQGILRSGMKDVAKLSDAGNQVGKALGTTSMGGIGIGYASPAPASSIGRLPQIAIGRPIQLMSSPHPALVKGDPQSADVWKWLAEATSINAATLAKLLNNGQAPLDLPAYSHDVASAVYRLSWAKSTRSEVHSLQGRVPAAPRHFAVVPRKRSVELISLPVPWRVIGSGREASIEIAVQQMHASDAFCASSTARDEEFGMLLGYLSSGSLSVVREMAETARDLLYGKFENPYAAAAGGYAMVGTSLQASDREWHAWIRTLMTSFPHIPDGAIQWAQLRLRMRRSTSDIDEASQALKLAYRRGLPFYSMGVKWLMEGLEWIAGKDPEAAEMLRNVRRIAWRTNFQQPFTIVRIGGETNV